MARKSTQYPHRRNRDGSYESICSKCYATVARAETDAELTEWDAAHVCDPSFLAERGLLTREQIARRDARRSAGA
jgi:hypothetical protein